jgi:ABC-type transport system substrate-binding protein
MATGLPPGAQVGGYVVRRSLGRGGMGEVYLADDPALDRPVALKLLEPSLAADERFVRRFLLESKLAARLDHPAIVPVFAAGQENGRLYIAMRYIPGGTLQDHLADGPLEPAVAIKLLGQIASALDAAHAEGLIHRDVKPGNILLDGDRAYLGDFGLARVASSIDSLSREQGLSGTLAYMAPEQIEGEQVDGRADQYALGCVLVQALTGTAPFERDTEVAQIYAHLSDPPPSVTSRRPELPAALDDVIARALAKKPDDRYATCMELIGQAGAALAGDLKPAARRRRRWPLVSAAGAAALAAIAAVVALRGGEHHTPAKSAAAATIAAPSSITWYDPVTFRKKRSIHLPAPAFGVLFDDAYIYAPDAESGGRVVTRIDRTTGEVHTFALPGSAGGLVSTGHGLLWASNEGPRLALIDAATGVVTKSQTLPTTGMGFASGENLGAVTSVAADADAYYVGYGDPGVVARIDRQTLRVERVFSRSWSVTHNWDVLVAVDDDALWVVDKATGDYERIDKRAGTLLAKGKLHGGFVQDATVAGDYLWLPVSNDRGAWKIDRNGATAGIVPTGGAPWQVTSGAGAAWVSNGNEETITRIDPVSGAKRQLVVGVPPNSTAIDPKSGDLVVVTDRPVPTLPVAKPGARVANILLADDFFVSDPAVAFGSWSTPGWAVQKAIGLGLTRVAYDPNPHIVPDGAASYSVSPDGRTYTFRIRSGLRFSPPSGKPITAETFRASIERSMTPGFQSDAADTAFNYLSEVAGAQAFHDGKADHVAGLTATGDVVTIRLAKPDGALPAILSMIMYQAVPDGTAVVPGGQDWLPSGGPYYMNEHAWGNFFVLRRNPNYHGDRKASLDEIVFHDGWAANLAAAQVIAGKADTMWAHDEEDLALGKSIARSYAEPAPGKPVWQPGLRADMTFLQFNTARPAFRDPSLRKAVSAALDRVAYARTSQQEPFDSILIPGSPGYEPHPTPPPDPTAVRALLQGRHPRITFYHPVLAERGAVAEIVRQLDGLGFRVTEKGAGTFTTDDRQIADRPGEPWDIRLDTWIPDFPDVGMTLNVLVVPEEQTFRWNMPRAFRNGDWNTLIRRATGLTGRARDQTYDALAKRLLAEQAPIAVLATTPNPVFASQRLGCVVPTRDWIDLEQLCLAKT